MILSAIIFSLLFFPSYNEAIQDFCVANLKGPQNPAGYDCKNPDHLTVNDFIFSGLRKTGNTSNIIKSLVTPAFVGQFPALNGLGVSVARLDMEVGGIVPVHTHPDATEVLFVMRGSIYAGFVSNANKAYYKHVKAGDSIVFPKGLAHFQVNAGTHRVSAFLSFSSEYPGLQVLDSAVFAKTLPSVFVEKNMFLDVAQVEKLKDFFNGSN